MFDWLKRLAAVSALAVVAACGGGDDDLDNVVQIAQSDSRFSILAEAVVAADLADTLSGPGPFTVFAPTNAAFKLLPDGTVETLLKPENKNTLTAVLTYHVVSGRYDAKALMDLIKKGNGTAMLKTVNGASLWFMKNGERNIIVKDAKGDLANISVFDVYQSNGVIQVIDKVMLPA
jgi:uncharacterized surface protein with fasciclin (FAS1) repeats